MTFPKNYEQSVNDQPQSYWVDMLMDRLIMPIIGSRFRWGQQLIPMRHNSARVQPHPQPCSGKVIRQSAGPTPDYVHHRIRPCGRICHDVRTAPSSCSFSSTMSSTSSKKMSSNFKDLSRKLVSKVKEPFTRSTSRLPSSAPPPVPDHSSVGPTQGGNDEGVS